MQQTTRLYYVIFFEYLYEKSDNAEILINQKSIYTQLWSKVYTEKIEGFPPKIISTNLDTEILNQLIELKSWTRVTKIFANQENYLSRIYTKDRLSQSEAILAILALEDLGCPLSYYPELSQKLHSAELPEAQKSKLKKLQERSDTLSLTSCTNLQDTTDTYEKVLRALFTLDFETAECILFKWAPLGKDKLKKALFLSLFNDNLSKELTLEYIKDEPDYNERFLATRLLNLFDHTYPPKYSIDKYINANAEDYWLYMDWLYSQAGKDNAKKVSPYGKTPSRNIIGGNKKNIDYEKSIRVLNNLLELPALFTYHNYIIIRNNDDWYNVSKNIYEDHPYATMFYTLQCNDKSVITRIAQDFAYNDTLAENYLPDILQRLLRAVLNPKTPSFLIDSILTFAGELFISVKPSKWKETFMNIWNIKFLPLANSLRNHNPILKFVLKAIRFIDNGKARIQIVKDCLTHSNSENYEVIINLLYLLQIKNKDKKHITLLKENLDQFINNISNPYEITISGNIKPLLTDDHIKIIQSRLKVLMENSNTPEVVYRSAVNFVKKSKLETDFFIESLIKSKNLWDNGILSKGQITECHPILLSDITCKLSIEEKFIHQIYIKLKNSLTQLIDNKLLAKEFTIFDYSVLLLEMQYFLNKYQKQLENFPDYNSIKENLTKRYREYKGFNSIEDGLYSSDINVYNTALEEMYINRWGYSDNELDRYAMIITNRILFVQLGDVQTSLNYLHALLKYKYIRLDNSDLLQNLIKILEKYSKELLQKYNINVFEASRYLVSIANILSKSGIESKGVEKWKHLGESKRFCGIDDI